MSTFQVLLHVAAQRNYELHSLDFSTAFFCRAACTRRSGCAAHLASPSDESVEPSGPYPRLVGYLIYPMTCTRPDFAYPLSLLARYVAHGRHQKLQCEAEIYAGAMAAQELRWLTYLLTYLGERPHSPPVLYVVNKAMIALCQEHRLEHGTKHIALRYFLARELQQRGQLACFDFLDWSCDHLFSPTLPMGSALKDVESNLCSVASASDVVHPPLFHGCTVPQLPTFTASLATAATYVTAAAVTTSLWSRGRSGRRGGQGAGGGQALHTFTLDSGASRYFFRDSTTLTPLPSPVPVRLTDPLGGPVLARSTTVLPCLVVPSDSLLGLHLTSFSTNLVAAPCSSLGMLSLGVLRLSEVLRVPRHNSLAGGSLSHRGSCVTGDPGAGGVGAGGAGAGAIGAGDPGAGGNVVGDPRARGTGARDSGAGGARAGGAGAGGTGAVDSRAGGTGAGDPGAGGTGTRGAGGGRARAGGLGGGGAGAGGAGAGGAGAGGARAGDIRAGGARAGDPRAGGAGAGGAGAGGTGAGGTGARDPGAGGAGAGGTGAGGARAGGTGAGGAGVGSAGAGGAGAEGTGAGGTRAGGAGAGDPGSGGAGDGGAGASGTGAGGTVQRRPFFVLPPPSTLPPPGSVLHQVLSLLSSTGLTLRLLCSPPHQLQPQLQQDSSQPAPSPYAVQTDTLIERHEPVSRPASPVCAVRTGHRVPRPRPPPVPSTHITATCAASPTTPRLLAIVVTDPSFESAAASALVAELVDLATTCRLDYASSLVAESESDCPPSVGGECALGTDVFEDRQEDFECLAAAVPHLVAMLLALEGETDAPSITTPRSYAEAITVPPSGANIVDGMWIFRGVDFFQTFSPTPKMTILWMLLHVAAQRDYELHFFDFSTNFLQGSLHEEIWLRRPPGFTESFPPGTQWSVRRPVYGLRQAPRVWHDTLRKMLTALRFAPLNADPSLFLRTCYSHNSLECA
ncbi:unnamed protein product [Closterium sp. NIES-53]